jgi:rSAM/selenodomain-associated transferase 1
VKLPPAVAVMAKVPGATPVKSRLHAALTPEQATELYRCFLLDRLEGLGALPGIAHVVAFTPPEAEAAMAALAPPVYRLVPQEGDGLGERLTHLFARLLGEGHGGVVALDSDSPTLPMAYVADAALTLAAGDADVVLGPSDDGGYYLIGLRVACPPLFDGVPWSTPRTRAATLDRCHALGLSVRLLPPWFDVDTADDLARLRAGLGAAGAPPRTAAFVRTIQS